MIVRSPDRSLDEAQGPPHLLRIVYAAAIPLAAGLAAWHGSRLVEVAAASSWIAAVFGCVAGCMAADVVTGSVHWACDTWGSEHTPWVGSSLIRSFREHHTRPLAMLEHDWIEVNGEAATAAAAGFALLACSAIQAQLTAHPFVYATCWSLILVSGLANQLHQWAHAIHPPGAIVLLQRAGLVLAPTRHARHHRGAHTAGYCITTGWMNPLLDSVGFWRTLERAVSVATGARPRDHEDVERDANRP